MGNVHFKEDNRLTNEMNEKEPDTMDALNSILIRSDNTPGKKKKHHIFFNANTSSDSTLTSLKSLGKHVDIDDCITRLFNVAKQQKRPSIFSFCLKQSEIMAICKAASEVFLSQASLIELDPPVKILGDVHGQFSDLIRIFELGGYPPASNYLFLGDYVDRGQQSMETMLLLLCYKIKYPENFFLLRGNHESANVNKVYGFYDECKRRTNVKVWKAFVNAFNTMPLAAIVGSKIFCVHGGLSPSLVTMDDIRNVKRPTEVPESGLITDLLWSDPAEVDGAEWEDNDRGVSYCFGEKIVDDFLSYFNFDLLCRAHMVVEDGYMFFYGRKVLSIFSAPNYCGTFDNFGTIFSVSKDLLCSFDMLSPLPSNRPIFRRPDTSREHFQSGM